MNTIKRLAIVAVAAIVATALCSCGKENAEGSSSALIGTWELVKCDYSFCGESVGSEVISKNNLKWIFREDGICENIDKGAQDDDEIPIPYFQYKYSAKNKTLSLILGMFVIDCDIIKLNSSDLVLSCPNSRTFLFYGTYKKGEEVDTYKGVTIYQYCVSHDGESYWDGEYCYKDSKGNIVPCSKISDEEFDGVFSGDENGYYDTVINYFKRVK